MREPSEQELYEWLGLSPQQASELIQLLRLERQASKLYSQLSIARRRQQAVPGLRYGRLDKAAARANRRWSRRRKAMRQRERALDVEGRSREKWLQTLGASERVN